MTLLQTTITIREAAGKELTDEQCDALCARMDTLDLHQIIASWLCPPFTADDITIEIDD